MADKPHPRRFDPSIYPASIDITARFGDMDVGRHLNNVAVARYYEDARVTFNRRVFGPEISAFAEGQGLRILVARVAIDYVREGRYPGLLTVRSGASRIGRTSFGIASALFQDGACLGISDAVIVCASASGPVPVPADIRARLAALQLPTDAF